MIKYKLLTAGVFTFLAIQLGRDYQYHTNLFIFFLCLAIICNIILIVSIKEKNE